MARKTDLFDLPESSVSRLLREHLESPGERLQSQLESNPAERTMRDYRETAAYRALMQPEESAATSYIREIRHKLLADPSQRALEQQIAAAKAAILGDPVTERVAREFTDAKARIVGDPATFRLDEQLAQAKIDALGLTLTGGIEDGTLTAYRKLLAAGTLTGGITESFIDVVGRHGLMSEGPLASLTGSLSDIARTNQWASILGDVSSAKIGALFSNDVAHAEIERLNQTVLGYVGGITEADRLRMQSVLGLDGAISAQSEVTRLKLSALAGASDVLGFQAMTSQSAYRQLFGDWHTRPDLPARFWRDSNMRRRMYDEAEVDIGLVEATPGAAIEIIVESGFVAGASDGENAIALFDIGGVSMRVRSSDFAVDAYRALVAFEQQLRIFVGMKMEAAAGRQWFKQRVDGTVQGKAKQNRATALANGETGNALLHYVDLGDLIGILLRKDNWDQVFGHIFPNRQRLEFDLQALVATRRPTMHARPVDSVRLIELMCIMRRLTQFMAGDGEWKRHADHDD